MTKKPRRCEKKAHASVSYSIVTACGLIALWLALLTGCSSIPQVPNEQPFLGPPGQIQPQVAIHPPELLVIPPVAGIPQPIHVLPEPPAGLRLTQGLECRNDCGIALSLIDHRSIVRSPTQSDALAGPLNRKAALCDQVGHDLPPLNRPQSFFAMTSFSAACSSAMSA